MTIDDKFKNKSLAINHLGDKENKVSQLAKKGRSLGLPVVDLLELSGFYI